MVKVKVAKPKHFDSKNFSSVVLKNLRSVLTNNFNRKIKINPRVGCHMEESFFQNYFNSLDFPLSGYTYPTLHGLFFNDLKLSNYLK